MQMPNLDLFLLANSIVSDPNDLEMNAKELLLKESLKKEEFSRLLRGESGEKKEVQNEH